MCGPYFRATTRKKDRNTRCHVPFDQGRTIPAELCGPAPIGISVPCDGLPRCVQLQSQHPLIRRVRMRR